MASVPFPFPNPVPKIDFPPKFVRLLLKLPSKNLHSGLEPKLVSDVDIGYVSG